MTSTDIRRVAVVGGAGFLGSHLVDRLVADPHTAWAVEVVDDLSTGSLGSLATARAQAVSGRLSITHLDATGPEFAGFIERRRPEVVVHLAGFSRPTAEPAAAATESVRTLTIAASILEACRSGEVTKVVTCVPAVDLYGAYQGREVPLKESRGFTPDATLGIAARTVIDWCTHYRDRYALEFTVLALGDVYGPRHPVVSDPVAAAIAGRPLERTLDPIYVADVAEALVSALDRAGGLVVNVSSGDSVTASDLARAAGREPVAVALRPQRFALSLVRSRIHLAWAPWTPLADGLATI